MKIISLQSKNVKNLKAIEINPDGNTVMITGKNGAGKSSVLDSILYAFSGKSIPEEPIRQGEDKAVIKVDCGDFTITRTLSQSGSRLKIEAANGKINSPQSFLDKIVGKISFDPMEFIQKDEKKQAGILMDLVGIDFESMAEREKELEFIRREKGRVLREKESAYKNSEYHHDAPEESVSLGELYESLNAARKHNEENERAINSLSLKKEGLADLCKKISEIEDKLADLKSQEADFENEISDMEMQILGFEPEETTELESQIADIDSLNRKVIQNQENERLRKEYQAAGAEYQESEKDLTEARESRTEAMRTAKFPIEGLSFGEKKVLFRGLPLKQLSSAEQIKVGLAVSMALNPKMRVLRITDGSLLDQDSLDLIKSMADSEDYQVWIERVEDGDPAAIVIEDGKIKE